MNVFIFTFECQGNLIRMGKEFQLLTTIVLLIATRHTATCLKMGKSVLACAYMLPSKTNGRLLNINCFYCFRVYSTCPDMHECGGGMQPHPIICVTWTVCSFINAHNTINHAFCFHTTYYTISIVLYSHCFFHCFLIGESSELLVETNNFSYSFTLAWFLLFGTYIC